MSTALLVSQPGSTSTTLDRLDAAFNLVALFGSCLNLDGAAIFIESIAFMCHVRSCQLGLREPAILRRDRLTSRVGTRLQWSACTRRSVLPVAIERGSAMRVRLRGGVYSVTCFEIPQCVYACETECTSLLVVTIPLPSALLQSSGLSVVSHSWRFRHRDHALCLLR